MQQLYNERIDEKILLQELDNGLKVYIMPKRGYTKQFAIFATHFGSNDSKFIAPGDTNVTEVPDGVAHFLEHKMFEEEEGSIFEQFSKLGASANAYTNFTTTAYLFASTENFYENLKLLVKFVQNPYFTDENVEKEKGIIAQEIRMYQDDPNWRVYFNALEALYHVHPVRKDIAGTIESISQINKEILYKCYYTFYHPENMVLFAVGDIDIDKTLDVIKENVRQDKKQGEIERIYPKEPSSVYKKEVVQDMQVSIPLFNLGFKDTDVGFGGKKLLKKNLEIQIGLEMALGRSSDLYERLYNEGLIDSTFSFDYGGEIDYGYSIIGGQSKDPFKVRDIILNAINNLQFLKEEDFERIKKKYIGKFLRTFNSVDSIAYSFINFYMKEINLLDYLDLLYSISFEDVRERFQNHLREENSVLSVVNPIKK
ncbi:pitrilysin family protein [Thermoanaerobacter thermohydrosulfuricus]|uniref:Putative Zn-dependent peptidase n=2 Tax=Thermoanaerobacter TaxID=1754 RepID=I8R0A2_9THEO|nr:MULTISPECIES: pitrilysin family protein [Thermoanaerobacter]EGD50382.1 peptidase M16 domain protein [Thermoanaerobacter ethanolicus JW 200]EIW00868.1 putative Zn-dependent peptidase [Thermoanaerobacter siderophilus SR4]EMT38369.1 putative Zn-dependent peptidase [Thermoanaerobacter thermohydrosulfuricus WC1]UZQ82085.1 insulinase family protein [Thermoanaerobacter sp. RKWS2]